MKPEFTSSSFNPNTTLMKKALVLIYLIVAVQTFLIIVAFKFGVDSMRAAFRYSQESILEICDQRYVQK